jgi:hypothetical protein
LASEPARFAAALLWLTLVTAGAPVAADEPNEIDRDAARALVQQGDARAHDGDWSGALTAYRRADDIMKVPTTSIEVGRAALKLGKLVEAKRAFERAAKHEPTPGEPKPFTRARSEARRMAEELEPRLAHLKIAVRGAADGVEVNVTIDDEPVEAWARERPFDPGMHVVVASADGHEPATESLVLGEGEKRELTLTLSKIGPEVQGATEPTPEPAGGSGMWPLAVTGLGVAGAGLLVGAITGGISLSDASAVKDSCDEDGACAPEVADQLDRSRTLANVSTASFVIAGVGAIVGVIGLVLALGDDDAAALERDHVTLRF